MSRFTIGSAGVAVIAACGVATGCAPGATPAGPSDPLTTASELQGPSPGGSDQHMLDHGDKGYIDGWIDGSDVQLYYTKSYFCAEPPASGTASNCEIGAPPEVAPRSGPIPIIYAIAAVGFQPDLITLSCVAGSPCLNHPAMIDASRIGGPVDAPALSHSHILSRRGGGWFRTVNIRVLNLTAWNQIAAAKSLAKVRDLQNGNPNAPVPGVISADTATNIYFFIAGARPEPLSLEP